MKRAAGRTRDPAKDRAIIRAAREVFLDNGLDGMTMEAVAARACVSKVTVYSRFADKQCLFEAVVHTLAEDLESLLDRDDQCDAPLEARLDGYGFALLSFLFDPAHIRFKQAIMIQLRTMPEFARRFFDAGPGSCRARMGAVLADAAERGEIVICHPEQAAEDLMALWKGFDDVEMEFGLIERLTEARIREKVTRGTRGFLRMVRV